MVEKLVSQNYYPVDLQSKVSANKSFGELRLGTWASRSRAISLINSNYGRLKIHFVHRKSLKQRRQSLES